MQTDILRYYARGPILIDGGYKEIFTSFLKKKKK